MNTIAGRELRPPVFQAEEPELETLDLVRYWRAIGRNKWRIAGLVAAVGVLATLIAFSLAPVYRATATLLIESHKPKLVSIEEIYSTLGGAQREYYQTQVEILKSREPAERLVRRLQLTRHPEYDPRQREKPFYAAWLPDGFLRVEAGASPSEEAIEQRVVSAVQRGIVVQAVRNSQLIKLSFEAHDRALAAQVPNVLADIYIQADLESRTQMTRRAITYLTEQADDLRRKLTTSETALQQFRDRERIVDAKNVSLSGASKQLEDLASSLVAARRKRADAETALNQVLAAREGRSTEALESLPAVERHPLVLRLKEAAGEAERKLNEAAKRYGPEHPRMITAQTELASAKENLHRQINAVVQTLAAEVDVAKANETATEQALERAKADIRGFNRKEFQLGALEREVATSRQLYDMFMQRAKETNLSGEMQTAIARVIDPAVVAQSPYGPNKRLIVGLALLGALLAGVSLAILIERLDNTVKTTHEVESKLEVPAVGAVQFLKAAPGENLARHFVAAGKSPFGEAIRTIRSGVLLAALDVPRKIVLVTSSVTDEGKTTVAINLALALSQLKKTLLVEADLRRPTIGRVLGLERGHAGLSEAVAGEAAIERCIQTAMDSTLAVLVSGRVPPNPLELLSSNRLADLLAGLQAAYDVIVIDSPPVQMVSDALVLSQLATEVLYVVRADHTPYPLARLGLKRLRRVNAPVLGAVLNQLDVEKADRYYGEYSGYGSTYGGKYGYRGDHG